MNPPIHDGDRELWLSRYLDGELTPAEKDAVAERIRTDSVWRAEFHELNADEALVARVIERYHQDSPLAHNVVRQIKSMSHRSVRSGKVKLHRRSRRLTRRTGRSKVGRLLSVGGWMLKLTGAAALVAASIYGYRYYHSTPDTVAVAPLATRPLPAAPAAPLAVLGNELVYTQWPDGTQIWSRKGSTIERVSDRSLKLDGEAFFHVAANPAPFVVLTATGAQAQALGTRFDVRTAPDGARVRVAEGHVRLESGEKNADAFGGTEILPDLHTRSFDPRALVSEWSKLTAAAAAPAISDGLISAWPQNGGSASHTNITPLAGPVGIVARTDAFLAAPEKTTLHSAAVIGTGSTPRAYVLARNHWESSRPESEQQTSLLAADLNGAHRGAWKTCATFGGYTDCAPLISPRGLVVFATPDGTVKAFDPSSDKIAWSVSLNSTVYALTAASDETIYCSTYAGVAALDGHNGLARWRCGVIQMVKAPATVLNDGTLCAVSEGGVVVHLDATGRVLLTQKWGEKTVDDAPVSLVPPLNTASGDDTAWLTSADGTVARISLHDGSITEKRFGKQPVFGPLGSGLVGTDGGLIDFTQTQPLAGVNNGAVVALLQDGRGDIFAGFKNGVLHQRASAKEPEFVHITRGELLRSGLAIVNNLLVVSTTQGLQVFE